MLLCAAASMAVAAAPSQDGKNLSAMFGYSAFYLPDSKQPYVETYLNFNASSLTFVPGEDGKYSATVEVTLVVRRDDTVAYVKKYDLHSPQTSNAELHNFTFFDLQRFALANGIYDLQLTLRDKGSDKPPYVMNDRLVVYFPSGNASMSNIQLMSSATPTEQANMLSRNGFDMVPYVDDFVPATIAQLHPYVEVYNLDKELGSDSYVVYFSIEQKETERRIAAYDTFVRRATKENDAVYGTIDIASLPSGNYNLVMEIMDKDSANAQIPAWKTTHWRRHGWPPRLQASLPTRRRWTTIFVRYILYLHPQRCPLPTNC